MGGKGTGCAGEAGEGAKMLIYWLCAALLVGDLLLGVALVFLGMAYVSLVEEHVRLEEVNDHLRGGEVSDD